MNDSIKRERSIDAVAGLMIIVMVLGHCGCRSLILTMLNFFMPWFYFKSGMYYREQTVRKTIILGGQKLLSPYVIYTFFGWFVACVLMFLNDDYNWIHYVLTPFKEILKVGAIQGNLVLWFLPTLFASKVIFNWCYKKEIKPEYLALVALAVSMLIYYTDNPVPPYVTTMFTGLFFYCIGYMFRERQRNTIVAITSIGFLLSFWIFGVSAVNMKDNNLLMGYYPFWFIFSIAGCVSFNYLFSLVPYSFPVLRWVGINSLVIYCTHWILLNIEKFFVGEVNVYILETWLTLFIITMFIEVFIVYIKSSFGNR